MRTTLISVPLVAILTVTSTLVGPSAAMGSSAVATIPVEADPASVAITPNGQYAYVANEGADTVSKVNMATNVVEDSINVGDGPTALVVAPDGQKVYVANEAGDSVSVIGVGTDTVTDTISLSASPTAIGITANSQYVFVGGLASSTRINTTDTTDVDTLAIPTAFISGVASAPNSSTVYLGGAFAIYEIDAASNALAETIQYQNIDEGVGIVLNPAGTIAYIPSKDAFDDPTGILQVNLSTGAQTLFPLPPYWMGGIAMMGNRFLYVTDRINNLLYQVSATSGVTLSVTSTGSTPVGLAANIDGSTGNVLVANYGSNTVSRYEASFGPMQQTPAGGCVTPPRSPNGVKLGQSWRAMTAGCKTNAGQQVKLRVDALRGDVRTVRLYCVDRRVTRPTRTPTGSYCARGRLMAQVLRRGWFRAVWTAPADSDFGRYYLKSNYRVRG